MKKVAYQQVESRLNDRDQCHRYINHERFAQFKMRLLSVIVISLSVFSTRPVAGELSQSELCIPYDPDTDLPTPKIILRHGYPVEKYLVRTEDGYLLEIHRIPHGKNGPSEAAKPPVFLQHGFLGSSADFIIAGPEKSYAYILADRGYDVWLGNARGNTYSRHHVSLNPKKTEFWDFSYHEMGYYDLPAVIDFILRRTGRSDLIYVGHSMGTAMFYILTATRPEYTSKIRGQFSLAPIAFMSHVKSPIRYLTPIANDYKKMMEWIGNGEFLGRSNFMKKVTQYVCEYYMLEEIICENYIFILCGFDREQFNRTMLPVLLGHTPAGASSKTLVHFAQAISSGRFANYDYGSEENMIRYGSITPPEYDVNRITVPVSLYYAHNDFLSDSQDVAELEKLLPNVINSHLVDYAPFNHLDFLWSNDVRKLIMDRVLNDIEALATFDFAEYDAFFSTFTNNDLNITDFVDFLFKKKPVENVTEEILEPKEMHSSKLLRAFLINKFSHQLNPIEKETDVDPPLSDFIDDWPSDIDYEDEEPKVLHPGSGQLQLMNWKDKAEKALRFYDKTVRVFKDKLAKYEEIYRKGHGKVEDKVSNVKDKMSNIHGKFSEKMSNMQDKFSEKMGNIKEKMSNVGKKISDKYDSTVNKSLQNLRLKISDYEKMIREKLNLEGKKQAYDGFMDKLKTKAKQIEQRFLNLPRKMVNTYNDIKGFIRRDRKTPDGKELKEEKKMKEEEEEEIPERKEKAMEKKSKRDEDKDIGDKEKVKAETDKGKEK